MTLDPDRIVRRSLYLAAVLGGLLFGWILHGFWSD